MAEVLGELKRAGFSAAPLREAAEARLRAPTLRVLEGLPPPWQRIDADDEEALVGERGGGRRDNWVVVCVRSWLS